MFLFSVLNVVYGVFCVVRQFVPTRVHDALVIAGCAVRTWWRGTALGDAPARVVRMFEVTEDSDVFPVTAGDDALPGSRIVAFYMLEGATGEYAIVYDADTCSPFQRCRAPYVLREVQEHRATSGTMPPFLLVAIGDRDVTELVAKYAGPLHDFHSGVPAAAFGGDVMVTETGQLVGRATDVVDTIDADMQSARVRLVDLARA